MFFKKRIVVGITTTPKRINELIPTLESIINQTRKPDKIVLSLSYEIARTGQKFGKIPNEILEYIKGKPIEILRVPDYGPATKFVGLLLTETNPKTYLIWVDDDVIYNKNAIKILVKHVSKVKHSIACTSMFEVDENKCVKIKSSKMPKNIFCVIDGYAGACCRLRDMPSISNFPHCTRAEYRLLQLYDKFQFNSDNFMISYYLHKNKVKFIPIIDTNTCDTIRNVGMDVDALHNIQNHASVYKRLYGILN